jgi:hypothetical protein
MVYSSLNESQRNDADFAPARRRYRRRARSGGCSGGYHVVHNQDVFALESSCILQLKNVFHIFISFRIRFSGLRLRVAGSRQIPHRHRELHHIGYSIRNTQTLIVSAQLFLLSVQGYGHKQIRIVEQRGLAKAVAQLLSQTSPDMPVALVFQPMNHRAILAFPCVGKQRGELFNVHISPEKLFSPLSPAMDFDGKVVATGQANTPLVSHERRIACFA